MEKDWWKKHLSEDGHTLDLRGTELTSLDGIDLPQGLQQLDLSSTELTSLDGVKLPKKLKSLDLSNTRLISLDGVGLPQGLQELFLNSTKITSLDGVDLPQGLQRLALSGTELTSLDGVVLPQGLQWLVLSYTKLTSLDGVGLPQGLQRLALNDTKLTSLDGVVLPQGLQGLYLINTKITSLDRVGLPQCLENLSLRRTSIKKLPESIRRMKFLQHLDLTGTHLEELPLWLPELGLPFSTAPFGDGINLYETTIKGVDMSIFDQSQESILEWFEEQKLTKAASEEAPKPLNELKVVFLGDGEAGKSHTIARLLNGGKQVKKFRGVSTPASSSRTRPIRSAARM